MTMVETGVMSFEEEERATVKEHRQPPEEEKASKLILPSESPEGISHVNTLTLAWWNWSHTLNSRTRGEKNL